MRNFRTGIEAGISCFKRAYGGARCTWRGLDHLKAYIWSAVVAHNLMLFARLKTGITASASPSGSSRNQPDQVYSSSDSAASCCYQNAKAVRLPTRPLRLGLVIQKYAFMDGH